MKVLVTGASGFIGTALVRLLADAGHEVTALVRRPAAVPPMRGVQVVVGDLGLAEGLSEVTAHIQTADAVAHLAALRKDWGIPAAQSHRVNVTSGVTLLQRAQRVRRFLFVSSVGVHGYSTGLPIAEESPLAPYDSYGASKVAAERGLRQAAAARDASLVVVRPGIVYGPGDTYGMVTNMARLIARRRFVRVGRGWNRVQLLYADDLARGLFSALTSPAADGQTFIFAGREQVTLRRLTALIARTLGARLPPTGVPEAGVRIIASVLEQYAKIRGSSVEPFVTHSKVNLMTRDYLYDTGKARALLGFEPAVDVGEGIARTMAWLRASGLLAR